ncbi:MAG: pyruvate, water dikinase regulatory protein [Rubricella sp.]
MNEGAEFHIHVVSDSTGETANAVARAALAQFDGIETVHHRHVFVRAIEQVDAILAGIEPGNSVLLYTLSDPKLADRVETRCTQSGIDCISLISPVITALSMKFGQTPRGRPGRQYGVDQAYLDRISALDFAMSHDDGLSADHLLAADVILIGVSRTSKTPTSIYLAYQGVKAANVPLVPRQDPPAALFDAISAGVPAVGLVATPNRLAQVRQHRVDALARGLVSEYADVATIREEVAEARLFFDRHGLPVIDVTRRSIEETAAAILALLRERGAGA